MSLIQITEITHNIILDLRYATQNNITGKVIFEQGTCFLHEDALVLLERAIHFADQQGLRIKIYDAYRPRKVQEALWTHSPDPNYITPPERGSAHTRGVAIDLTLVNKDGKELDMGTPFDDLTPNSHHSATTITPVVALNRYTLLGIMMSAGWDFFDREWWHYQLFKSRDYPLIDHNH
jgi:zinc D-Ala-D-Ala dipeptidase